MDHKNSKGRRRGRGGGGGGRESKRKERKGENKRKNYCEQTISKEYFVGNRSKDMVPP